MNLNLKAKLDIQTMKTEQAILKAISDFEEETGFEIGDVILKRARAFPGDLLGTVKASIEII